MKIIKRIFIIFCIVTMVVSVVACTKGNDTENVFDKLYYEVKSVEKGHDSVLLKGTKTAYADYDVGAFQNVQIPDLNMCLDFDDESLYMLFFNYNESEDWNTSFCVLYRYDISDKKLYGEKELDFLNDNFLSHYFEWCNAAGEMNTYSLQNLGTYTFILEEKVHYN